MVIYREFSPENIMKLSYRSEESCRFKHKLLFYVRWVGCDYDGWRISWVLSRCFVSVWN